MATAPDDILTELESVADFISTLYPTNTFYYQRVPEIPDEGDFAIRFQNADSVQETTITYVDTREWQVIYFGSKDIGGEAGVLTKMNAINKLTADKRRVLPIKDSLRYMRIGSFSFGAPLKTDDDRHAIIGVLTTEIRKARDLETYEKIMQVNARYV